MARATRKQTTIRAGSGAPQVNAPSDPVSGYAPYVNYVHLPRDSSVGQDKLMMGEALAGFGTTVAEIGTRRREAEIKARRLKGQADSLTEGPPLDWEAKREEVLADPEKGQDYWDTYSKQGAKVAGVAKAESLADDLGRRVDIDDVAKFDQWWAENTKDDLDAILGLDEDETTIQYATILEQQEMKLRNKVRARHAERVYNQTETDFHAVVSNDVTMAVDSGASGRDLINLITEKYRDGKAVLLQPQDINKSIVRAVGALAEAEGRPELMNIFEYPHADANDPTKQVPGLAFSSAHGPAIEDHKRKAASEFDKKVAENLKATQYAASKEFLGMAEEGNYEQAEAFNDLMVQEGVFTPAVGVANFKSLHKVNAKEVRINRDVTAITEGNYMSVNPAHRKDAISAYGDRQLEKAGITGDPEMVHEATKDIFATGGELGEMFPRFAAQLKTLNLVDPEQFAATMELADIAQGVSPGIYNDSVPKGTRAQIAHANRLAEAGLPQGDIMLALQELNSPEGIKRRKENAGDSELQGERRNAIRESVGRDQKFFFDGDEYVNADEVAEWVTANAVDYMTINDVADFEAAEDWAKEAFKSNFAVISLGEGRGQQAVYKGNLGLPENVEEQMQFASDSITAEMRMVHPDTPEDVSFYVVPDPTSRHSDERQFLVKDSLGRTQTELVGGIAVPMRVGQRQLESEWRTGMINKVEDEQEMQQMARERRDMRVRGNRRYYGVSGDVLRERYQGIGEPDITPATMEDAMQPQSNNNVTPPMETAVSLVKRWEGFRSEAYHATADEEARGIFTVGYGQTVGVKPGQSVSEEAAAEALTEQLGQTSDALAREVGPQWYNLNDNQQAAVISLAYNVDKDVVGQLKRSKALRALKRGDIETFLHEAFDPEVGFTKQSGKVLKGLVNRRNAERDLFTQTKVAQN